MSKRIVLQLHDQHRQAIKQASRRLGYASESAMMRDLTRRAVERAGLIWEPLDYDYGWQTGKWAKEQPDDRD